MPKIGKRFSASIAPFIEIEDCSSKLIASRNEPCENLAIKAKASSEIEIDSFFAIFDKRPTVS